MLSGKNSLFPKDAQACFDLIMNEQQQIITKP